MADLIKNLKVLNWGGVSYNVGWSENDFTNALKAKLEGIEEGAQNNIIEKIVLNGQEVAVSNKTIDLGQLQKMLKVGTGIAIAEDGTISTTLDVAAFKVVESLPSAPAAGNESKIHVVLDASGVEGNSYAEYLWDGSKWELLGKFKADMDLSAYAKTADVNAQFEAVNKTISDNKTAAETGIQEAKDAAAAASQAAGVADGKAVQAQNEVDALELVVGKSDDAANAGGSVMARINKVVEDINALNDGEGSIGTQIDNKLSAYDTATVQPHIADNVRHITAEERTAWNAAKSTADANKSKLDGISAGANKVSHSYDEASATLTITIE
jgi:hypothetical protein